MEGLIEIKSRLSKKKFGEIDIAVISRFQTKELKISRFQRALTEFSIQEVTSFNEFFK